MIAPSLARLIYEAAGSAFKLIKVSTCAYRDFCRGIFLRRSSCNFMTLVG